MRVSVNVLAAGLGGLLLCRSPLRGALRFNRLIAWHCGAGTYYTATSQRLAATHLRTRASLAGLIPRAARCKAHPIFYRTRQSLLFSVTLFVGPHTVFRFRLRPRLPLRHGCQWNGKCDAHSVLSLWFPELLYTENAHKNKISQLTSGVAEI